ncbi:2-hydroxycarboxylate transporter family protein, partial [Enterocloster asparagiformis]|uniref:2-hydroxycarboxylate transporter family protein n=1 Tax=Enterocloster asparagiformis TaxID=333367 RepID=UPI002A7ED814
MKENNQSILTTGNRFLMDMPTAWFMILSLIIVGAGFLGKLPTSMVGGFALFMSLGYLIRFVYWKVPLIKNTLGLASIGLTCAIIKHFGLWPENIVETMTNFIQGDTDFLSWFIAALITGSILGMNRELLIKAGIRYFVPITSGLVFAYLLGGLVGQAFGMSFKGTIFYIAGPIMGGGT